MSSLKRKLQSAGEQTRESIVRGLDKLIFRADTTRFIFDRPKFDYQPIPWKGILEAPIRGEATILRWKEMRKHIQKGTHKSLKDLGCCVGFFCISAADECGMNAIGVDGNARYLRIARRSIPQGLEKNCHFINMMIDKETVEILPITDVTLCLSIWHHWAFHYGLEVATEILNTIWSRTTGTMFFESGEEEVAEEFKLDFNSQPAKKWYLDYLQKVLPQSRVEPIGEFEAGNYAHYKLQNVKRTVFKISRNA
jgi:hypothetical protein